MPNPPRDLPHLFLEGGSEKAPYTAYSAPRQRTPLPDRDRAQHASKLSSELATAVGQGRAAAAERAPVSGAGGEHDGGFYLEFTLTSGPNTAEALQSLEDRKKGIELVAVRRPSAGTDEQTI